MADRRVAPRPGTTQGAFEAGQPTVIVIHSLEAPAVAGIAWSLATGWLQNAKVSIHAITDPVESVDMAALDVVGSHCGTGNQRSIGDEVTGYAAWTEAQWYEPKAFAALRLDAKKVAAQAKRLNIPLRWLSIAQLKAGERGLATHNDMRLAFGGTTHTDPGPNFPYAKFLQMCQQWAGEAVDPDGTPNPTTTGPGGAEGDDFVATGEEVLQALWTIRNELAGRLDAQVIPGISQSLVSLGNLGNAVYGVSQAVDAVDADLDAIKAVVATLTPSQVVDLLANDVARQVADEIATRLAG